MGPTPEAFRLGGLSGLIATFQLNVYKAFLKAGPSLTVTESPKSGLFFFVFFHFPSSCPGMQCVYENSNPGGGAKVVIFYYLFLFFLLGDKFVLSYYSQSGFGS